MIGSCGHCDDGRIGAVLCPHCWGTTVSSKALAETKAELSRVQEAYEAKQAANKKLRGRARGQAGNELSKIGDVAQALKAEIDTVEQQIKTNRTLARVVGAAAAAADEGDT
jgi:hypothetical protein